VEAREEAAQRLWDADESGVPCAPVRDLVGATDVDVAYEIQQLVTQRRIDAGQRLVGRKIGLTSPAVQQQLGVAQPDFGPLFAQQTYAHNADVPMAGLIAPRVEAEIALVLARDLEHPAHTVADVMRATEFALPALEVVDSRIRDWDITIVDTIADRASGAATVLGTTPVALSAFDPVVVPMSLTVNGEKRSTGVGAASLGNPLRAAVWLADELVRRGDPLRAGDVVLTGALGPVIPVGEGDEVAADLGTLGTVRCRFVAG
jgi:2-keto-4-pentenoate hydratase